ncbi:MAG: VOC family protein [Snowella sp.]|nr:VOC family protein [Snowella sp.]
MTMTTIFHLAIPVNDIALTKEFYCGKLGCLAGRETAIAVILNFYGHQVVAHHTEELLTRPKSIYPRHFGLIFPTQSAWQDLIDRIESQDIPFHIPPKWRFTGEITVHSTFFIEDPFYNLLEFKFYRHFEAIFAANEFRAIGDRPRG